MVNDAVDDGYGDVIILEEFAPVGEVFVGGNDQRAVFVEAVDKLEQVVT